MRVLTSADGERDPEIAIEQRDAARYWAASLEEDWHREHQLVELLTGALSRFTHEFVATSRAPGKCWSCGEQEHVVEHRTPAWLRRTHGLDQ